VKICLRLFYFIVAVLSFTTVVHPVIAQSETTSSRQDLSIKEIQLDGLLRVSEARVLNLLPVEVEDQYNSNIPSQIIRELYQTGLFQQVDIKFENNILFVNIVENPSVVSIEFEGNETFDDDVLTQTLKDIDISEGDIYQPLVGDRLIKELQRQYLNEGKYAADVSLEVNEVDDSRVGLKLVIDEGETAKIEKITIVGNQHFSDKEILSNFQSKAGPRWNPFSTADRYSRAKVSADIQELTNLYTDEGYADFRVTSSRVSINPEKDAVFLTISVEEGPR